MPKIRKWTRKNTNKETFSSRIESPQSNFDSNLSEKRKIPNPSPSDKKIKQACSSVVSTGNEIETEISDPTIPTFNSGSFPNPNSSIKKTKSPNPER